MQDETGAFRYPFLYKYYLVKEAYEPGWISGMAQGVALSVFARAYDLTQDEKYLLAGNKALEILVTPIEYGGTMSNLEDLDPSLTKYIFFEEYISDPRSYTLNGYMFALLGLYDWKVLNDKYSFDNTNTAQHFFELGIKTLVKILPYYDIGGFTTYDLGHITFKTNKPQIGIGYHAVHIYLLNALHQATGEPILKQYETLWSSYVD